MLAVGLFLAGVLIIIAAVLVVFWDMFAKNRLWALVSLILLVPLLIHALFNWSVLNIRRAWYGLVMGLITFLVSITGGALAHLPFLAGHSLVQTLEKSIAPAAQMPLANQPQADAASLSESENYDPLLTGSEYEQLSEQEIIDGARQASSSGTDVATGLSYHAIAEDQFIHAMNKPVRIRMQNGSMITGRLAGIIDDELLVESMVVGGLLGLSYRQQNIASLEVLLPAGERLSAGVTGPLTPAPQNSNAALQEQTLTPVMRPSPQAPKQEVIPKIIDNRLDMVQPQPLGSGARSSSN